MKKILIALISLATYAGCYANWTKKVDFSGSPDVYNLFAEVATVERGFIRQVTMEVLSYDIQSDGTIEVKQWGEPLCTLTWDGIRFVSSGASK